MSSQEYTITFLFLLLMLFWIGLLAWLTVSMAHKFEEGKPKTAILCIILVLIIIVGGIIGWKYLSDQPEWEFLKTPTCAECGETLHPDDNFCKTCGLEVVDEVVKCPACNAECDTADKFCAQCGAERKGE